MSFSEWEQQLRQLEDDWAATPRTELRATWESRATVDLGAPLLTGMFSGPLRTVAYLYADPPASDDLPVVTAPLAHADALAGISQGSHVVVHGWPRPGGAFVIVLPSGSVVKPAGPGGYTRSKRSRWARR